MFNGAYLSEAAYQGKRLGELLSFPRVRGLWGLGCWEILYQYGFKQGRAMAKPPRPFLLVV
jgi:hypothetical protein